MDDLLRFYPAPEKEILLFLEEMRESVNGLGVTESPYKAVQKEAGFRENFDSYILKSL